MLSTSWSRWIWSPFQKHILSFLNHNSEWTLMFLKKIILHGLSSGNKPSRPFYLETWMHGTSTGLCNFWIVTVWLRENYLACAGGRINSMVIIIIIISTLILLPSSPPPPKKKSSQVGSRDRGGWSGPETLFSTGSGVVLMIFLWPSQFEKWGLCDSKWHNSWESVVHTERSDHW